MITDIRRTPQTAKVILGDNILHDHGMSEKNFAPYIEDVFSPWSQTMLSSTADMVAKAFACAKPRYAENLLCHPDSWYSALLENANLKQFGQLLQKAIIVYNTSLRNMPTLRPAYHDPRIAGEGFPFDTIQENLLRIGDPILISHFTQDGMFAFVETNARSSGFVCTKHLALVDDKTAEHYSRCDFALIIKDHLNLYAGTSGATSYIDTVDLGTLFPIHAQKDGVMEVYLPARNLDGYVTLHILTIPSSDVITAPLPFTAQHVAEIIDTLIDKPYGWGGYLGHRDCAQILKDYFAVWGIHLPIFSGEQIKTGHYTSLEHLDNPQKLAKIAHEAQPCRTILYRKSHVVLYLGEYHGEPMIFHAVWGVPTYGLDGTEARHIIGKSAITSLEYGKELHGFDAHKSNFLHLLSGMTTLT